jgi:hypothetical protein
MPFNNTFNITRTSLFKNNLLKGKQLDYLNTKYWSLTGTYGDAVIVEDDNDVVIVKEAPKRQSFYKRIKNLFYFSRTEKK